MTQKIGEKQLIVQKKEISELGNNSDQPEDMETIANNLKSNQVELQSKPSEKIFSSRSKIQFPSSTKKSKCDLCDFESFYRKSIKRHKENIHNVQGTVLSDEIQQSPSPSLCVENQVFEEYEIEIFKCDICDFETKHKWNMKRHVDRVHELVNGVVSKNLDESKVNNDFIEKD